MHVLIVEPDHDLGALWQRHLERAGFTVGRAGTEAGAIAAIDARPPLVILLDLVLAEGSALAVADYAGFRRPQSRVIVVTNTRFFSDGSIFDLIANARAFLPSATPPEDILALVDYHGRAAGGIP